MRSGLLIVGMLLLAGCASRMKADGGRSTRAGVASIGVGWVKDKGEKFDLGFELYNEGRAPILVAGTEFGCGRGVVRGQIRQPAADEVIVAGPGQRQTFVLVCQLGMAVTGDY